MKTEAVHTVRHKEAQTVTESDGGRREGKVLVSQVPRAFNTPQRDGDDPVSRGGSHVLILATA